MADIPTATSLTEGTWVRADKGYVIQADEVKRKVLIWHVQHTERQPAQIPFENVSGWVEKPTAEQLAKLPPTLTAGVQTAPPPYYRGPSVVQAEPEAPKDIRPTVRLNDLGTTALQYYQEHGHVVIAGREHRVVP